MCEIVKGQRRTFRDQDPPRICNKSKENLKSELEFCESTATSPTILQRASSFEKCFNESKHLEKGKQNQKKEKVNSIKQESTWSDSIKDSKDSAKVSNELPAASNQTNSENLIKELSDKVPSNSHHDHESLRRTWVTRHDDDENDDDDEDKPPPPLSLSLFSRQRVLCTQPVRRVSRASCPPVSWRGALERATSACSRTLRNLLQPRTSRVKRGNFRLAILSCVFSFVTGSTYSPLTASNEPRYLLIEASSSIYSKEKFLWIVRGVRDVHAIVAREPLQSIFLELFSRVCTWRLFDDRESYVVTSFVDVIAFPAARCIGTVVVIEDVEGSVGTLTACRNLERLTELVVEDCTGYVHRKSVIDNGLSNDTDSCDGLTDGQKMAPVLGVPPPPPPAPHMGPDGLILPRKPYNPYLTSSNHKDLRRELLFNQKVGKNVLNQKSELQRALEKQREAASRREAERNREENYKDDPRTALQRAIEQRAKHIEMALEQSQRTTEPPSNLLVTARAKLRPRTDSQ